MKKKIKNKPKCKHKIVIFFGILSPSFKNATHTRTNERTHLYKFNENNEEKTNKLDTKCKNKQEIRCNKRMQFFFII